MKSYLQNRLSLFLTVSTIVVLIVSISFKLQMKYINMNPENQLVYRDSPSYFIQELRYRINAYHSNLNNGNSMKLKIYNRILEEKAISIAYSHGTAAYLWIYGEKFSEYPYACLCQTADLSSWKDGTLINKSNDKSPVKCADYFSGGILDSQPYCDPTNQ